MGTALDLVRYSRQIGGLDAVLTVLAELAETLQPKPLAAAAKMEEENAQVQRWGVVAQPPRTKQTRRRSPRHPSDFKATLPSQP
jgi:hypothetical protein